MKVSGSTVTCLHCGATMSPQEVIPNPEKNGPTLEFFQCPNESCRRHAAIYFEPWDGDTQRYETWVEREVRQRGSFFPMDYVGTPGRFK